MTLAVCPGSFDPVTEGHLDLVQRAAALFDEVVVAVASNAAKAALFSHDERAALLRAALARRPGCERVRVEALPGGLLAEHAAALGAVAVVKGVRTAADVEHETPMALVNRHLSGVDTVLLPADPRWAHVSSSLVKEVARLGGDVTGLVPDAVLVALRERLGGSAAGPGEGAAGRRSGAPGPTG